MFFQPLIRINNDYIDKFVVNFKDSNGQNVYADRINEGSYTGGGIQYYTFADDEFIKAIFGRYSPVGIRMMKIYTNKRTIQVGSSSSDYTFYVGTPSSHQILSFYGRDANYNSTNRIDRLGFECYTRN